MGATCDEHPSVSQSGSSDCGASAPWLGDSPFAAPRNVQRPSDIDQGAALADYDHADLDTSATACGRSRGPLITFRFGFLG